jgi:hypothetical protein
MQQARPASYAEIKHRAKGLKRQKTAAQLHRQAAGEWYDAFNKRVMASPLWDGVARSRRSWSSRMRELELHPDRLDAIRARP